MARVKVGVIGLGEVAQVIHLPILEALADRYEDRGGLRYLADVAAGDRRSLRRRASLRRSLRAWSSNPISTPSSSSTATSTTPTASSPRRDKGSTSSSRSRCASPWVRPKPSSGARRGGRAGNGRLHAPLRPRVCRAGRRRSRHLGKINYARIRDIIGINRLIIDQVERRAPSGRPPKRRSRIARSGPQRLVREAIGEAPKDIIGAYRLLLGLNSHDLSAMRELLGFPERVIAARHWNNGSFIVGHLAIRRLLRRIGDRRRRAGPFRRPHRGLRRKKSLRVQYDSPYIRHLPTTLVDRRDGRRCLRAARHPPHVQRSLHARARVLP